MSKKKFGIGLIVGAVAGLVAGLLTAPKSGKETRNDIKNKAQDVKKEAGKHVETAKQTASDVADQAKKTVDHVKEVTDTAVEGLRGGFAKGKADADKKESRGTSMAGKKKGVVTEFADTQYKAAPQALLEDLFEDYYQRRRQIYWMNFVRGIFLGFGGVIGGTIVVALVLWLLSVFQYVPFLDGITNAAQHSLQNVKK